MKKSFNTSVEECVQNDFKAACAKEGMQMNSVLELFMKAYSQGRFRVEIEYEKDNSTK